ncbi:hypothetical protein [Actinobacillus minor]|uniref:hypothetical protein n=1 Tax=Actinobacillus minor TaxID=51047 RepID=UPI0023F109B2|nr:hypothetical protein [Actinobacillus minor]MDD6911174.1 hypothetical protein [Actinobacillus minor]MDY4712489.1 hypothetical protein [Actinobacillus minor]
MNNSNILDFENPESVYQFTKSKIDSIIEKIGQIEQVQNDNQDANQHEEALKQLTRVQFDINQSIDEFRQNAEWKQLNISFFGETNAGKSTIIDTLRILLGESTKIEQQKKFKEIEASLDLDADKYSKIKKDLLELDKQHEELSNELKSCVANIAHKKSVFAEDEQMLTAAYSVKKELLLSEFEARISQLSDKQNELQEIINRKKLEMSWWIKILYVLKFVRLDEDRELVELLQEIHSTRGEKNTQYQALDDEHQTKVKMLEHELETYIATKNCEIQKAEDSIQSINSNKAQFEEWMQSFDAKKNQLKPYADGEIMGDGRSDFTLDSTVYNFEINKYPVGIIDVPGIEGVEKKVENEITRSVQKTHAVLYVTAKNAAPNEGTVNRIKQYIGDQTEVWTIFNKSIKSYRALQKGTDLSDDDKKSQKDMENKLKEVLGDHYRGTVTIAGLPAFFSQATCLIPFSDRHNGQLKYFENGFDRSKLFELSNLQSLVDVLKNHIVGDVKAKIRKSNFNKVKYVIDDSVAQLMNSNEFFTKVEQELRSRVQNTNHEIDNHFATCIGQIKRDRDSLLDKFAYDSQDKIYRYIDSDVSNDDFKYRFKKIVENNADVFGQLLQASIESRLEELSKRIEDSQKKLQNSIERLYDDSFKLAQKQGVQFDFNFKLDNGINTGGLIAALVTVGMALWWNPAGWVALGATVLTIAVGIAKSVWNFFDVDYKKAQQRKNVNSHLPKITSQLEESVGKSIKDLEKSLKSQNVEIRKMFNAIPLGVQQLNNDLSQAIREFKIISDKISI